MNRPVPGFAAGMASLFRGAGFLLRRPRLWPVSMIPAALTLLLFAGLAWAALALGGDLTERLTGGDWGFLAFLKTVVNILIPVLVILFMVGLMFFTFTLVGTAVASPFLDILSARTERLLMPEGQEEAGSIWKDALRSVGDTARLLALQIGVMVLTLALNFLPVAGTVAWVGIGAWMAAFDYLDFPLARHRVPWMKRWAFLKAHAGATLGFGLGVFLLLLIPFLNLFVLPVAVVGATLLYLELRPGANP